MCKAYLEIPLTKSLSDTFEVLFFFLAVALVFALTLPFTRTSLKENVFSLCIWMHILYVSKKQGEPTSMSEVLVNRMPVRSTLPQSRVSSSQIQFQFEQNIKTITEVAQASFAKELIQSQVFCEKALM